MKIDYERNHEGTNLCATNGLVNDYLEKEFGLNPNTVDTAGSHMLDTYNLTFDLGTNGLPSNIQAWSEPSVNPFLSAPAPGVAPPPGSNPIGVDWSNLSDMQTAGDNHPWSSEVLWDYGSLLYLNGLAYTDGDWLRAVTGSWSGHTTLTVWGKLSWGANPLTASTPGDGIADGARVNPLYEEDVQIGFLAGFIGGGGSNSKCGNLPSDSGAAMDFFLNESSPAGPNEVANYSTQAFACPSSGIASNINYIASIPVTNTIQYQSIAFTMAANISTCANANTCQKGVVGPIVSLPVNGCLDNYQVTLDMLNPGSLDQNAQTLYGNENGQCGSSSIPSTQIGFSYSTVPVGVKAPTYLWIPDDNSTLSSGLPVGLQRYVGEQDFVLVVADVSNTIGCTGCSYTSNPIPYAWGQDYPQPITVSQTTNGNLVNFLVPRGQFLNSVLGQAVLNGNPLPTPAGSAASTAMDQISGLTLSQLACYWQNLAVAPGGFSSPNTCTQAGMTLHGIDPGTPYAVTVTADSENCTQDLSTSTNCQAGGVPSDPTLSTSSPGNAAPAVQAVVTLNLTSNSDLNDLLAGLLDNNTVGANGELGVNGSFEAVTYQLPSLGLSSTVMGALANAIAESDGLNGTPVSEAPLPPPPPPPCSGLICVWNAVSGIVTNSLGVLVGVVWDAVTAATAFLDDVVQGLSHLAEVAVSAAVSALAAVGSLLEAALQALITRIINKAEGFLKAIWNDVVAGVTAYVTGMNSAFNNLISALAIAVQSPSSENLNGVSQASIAVPLSILDAQSFATTLNNVLDVISSAVRPILSLISIEGIMNSAMSLLTGKSSAAGSLMNSVGSLVNSGISSAISGMVSMLNALGLGQPVSMSSIPPAEQVILSNPTGLESIFTSLDSQTMAPLAMSRPLAQMNTYGQFAADLIQGATSSPINYIDFILTVVAAYFFAVTLGIPLAGFSGISADLWTPIAIVLTIAGFLLFAFGGFLNYVLSMAVDVVSIIMDLVELFLFGGIDQEMIVIADSADGVADAFDIGVSVNCIIQPSFPGCS